MIRRCSDPKRPGWENYGGRGIQVCEEWKQFGGFVMDMESTWKPGLSLDRKDNNGNYCKHNCRWATRTEQNNNSRRNKIITARGKSQTIGQWASELNLPYSLVIWRYNRGWDHERIITQPSRKYANI